jgi:DNA-binding NtrC family response regulator
MVVDDEYSMVNMLKEFLSAFGAQVDTFTCPIQALKAFTQHADNINLVITDQTMPGMSGMHLSERILEIKPRIPIILCTGYSELATPESVAKIGVAAFFPKPANMVDLIWKVQELLQQKTG